MHARWLLVLLLVLCDCARGARGSVGSVVGLTLPLVSSPQLRLLVEGRLHGARALVQLDPGAAMSFVTTGCRPSPLGTQVTVADPFGPDETFSVASVDGLELGSSRLAAFAPGLMDGHECQVVLGDDVLKGLALELHVGARTVTFHRSATAESWLSKVPAGDEAQALPLTRDPRHDWPLLAVQISQGSARLTGVVLFSARHARTRLFEASAHAAGLQLGFEVDQVELFPGFGVSQVRLELEPGAPPHTPLGVLGADVWGRFDAVIDVSGGVLVLQRPRVLTSGPCAAPADEQALPDPCRQALTPDPQPNNSEPDEPTDP
jgi:hypothetical protein